jgi:GntR family transcriptional regulator
VAGPTSKYEHVREQVLDLIEPLDVGAPIPPERELSARLGVARMTLRRAVDDLARDGYLIRRQGHGTFVAEPKITQQLTATSFSEDMRQRGMTPSSRTLSLEVHAAGARLSRKLEISPPDLVVVVRRLRLADGAPMAIEHLHVPQRLIPGLSADDLAQGSFYQLLATRYGLVVGGGLQTIEPTVTDGDESAILQVPEHSPALLFERTSREERGTLIEFVRSVYRGDRYRITAELSPSRVKPRSKRP